MEKNERSELAKALDAVRELKKDMGEFFSLVNQLIDELTDRRDEGGRREG